jgi:serine/threonine protein kinase
MHTTSVGTGRHLHRDIKPQNILVSVPNISAAVWDWSKASAKLADFGSSKHLVTFEDDQTAKVGTASFMPDEAKSVRVHLNIVWRIGPPCADL